MENILYLFGEIAYVYQAHSMSIGIQ